MPEPTPKELKAAENKAKRLEQERMKEIMKAEKVLEEFKLEVKNLQDKTRKKGYEIGWMLGITNIENLEVGIKYKISKYKK